MRRGVWSVPAVLLLAIAASGCEVPEPADAAPRTPESCASRDARGFDGGRDSGPPTSTKITYRGEEMEDGSVRMTVGDVDAAPESPDAVYVFDHRAPSSFIECDDVRIEKVRGWWCATTVEPIDVEGEIVLGDAEPRARIGGAGFATRCHGDRPDRMRQVYQVQRDSWSGWRDYGEPRYTSWTEARRQAGPPVWEPCPQGRVGTYDYQLIVRVEVDGVPVGNSPANSAPIRTDCGTGVS